MSNTKTTADDSDEKIEVPTAAIISGATLLRLNEIIQGVSNLSREMQLSDADSDVIDEVPAVNVNDEDFGEIDHGSLDFQDAMNVLRTSGMLAMHKPLISMLIMLTAHWNLRKKLTRPDSVFNLGAQILGWIPLELKRYMNCLKYDMKGSRINSPLNHPMEMLTTAVEDWLTVMCLESEASDYELDQEVVALLEEYMAAQGSLHYAHRAGEIYLLASKLVSKDSIRALDQEKLNEIFSWAPAVRDTMEADK